jgi:O-antigen/teichoic acid export membrane protein
MTERFESRPDVHATRQFRAQMGQISFQSAVFLIGSIFRIGLLYLFKVYLARTLGPEPLGIYTLGMTIIAFLGVWNDLGLPQAAVRVATQYIASGELELLRQFLVSGMGLILVANLALGLAVVSFGPWLAVHLYHTPALSHYLKLFAVIMTLGALTAFFSGVLQGYKHVSRIVVITNFIGIPLNMLAAVALIAWGAGLGGYILAQVISGAVTLALLMKWVWKLTPTARSSRLRPVLPEASVISLAATLAGMGLLSFLLRQSDKVLIGFFSDAQQLGIYTVAAAVVAFIPIVLQSVNQIFSPTISDLCARGEKQLLERLFQTLTRWVLVLTLPLLIITITFAKPIMRIFGPVFEPGWLVLVIGALGQLVNCGVGSVGVMLLMSGNERKLMRVQAFAAILTMSLGALLVPRIGIVGAAAASAITNIFTNIGNMLQVRRVLGCVPHNRSSLRLVPPAAAAALLAISSRAILHSTIPSPRFLALDLMLAYVAFLSVMVATGIDSDDRMIGHAVWDKAKVLLPIPDVDTP